MKHRRPAKSGEAAVAAATALPPAQSAAQPAQGYVDYYGYLGNAAGWVFCGWVARTSWWNEAGETVRVAAQFDGGRVEGKTLRVLFPRADLGNRGLGIVFYVESAGRSLGVVARQASVREMRSSVSQPA